MSRYLILCILIISFTACRINPDNPEPIKVLVLSGKNNHEWQKTTPVMLRMYENAGLFAVEVTERPDTLDYNDLMRFEVVVSNWNTWPDNEFRMPSEWENAFERFMKEGRGAVFIHAGASSFYGWNEYHQIGIGRWGKETRHGKLTKGKVTGLDMENPITRDIKDFYIMDEIWEKTDIFPGAKVLATVTAKDESDGHAVSEPAILINSFGKGLSFYTALGHDQRAFLNSGFQTVLLRATQWVAGRKVTIETPGGLKRNIPSEVINLRWMQTDTSLSLMGNSGIIWQYNFNNRFGRPYFHPVTVKNSPLTCVSPPDHPWHLGLWFCWKFINGVNYWEYLNEYKSQKTGYRSAGITEISKIETDTKADFSATINQEILYHPEDSLPVMHEESKILVSAPSGNGSYCIDFDCVFTSLSDEVILDRTPVLGEPDGKSWGGYAGLSVRFNQDYTQAVIISQSGGQDYRKDNWLYMGFNTLTGERAGTAILKNPEFSASTTSWYVINDPVIPFYYYSPAVLYDGKIILKMGDNLRLNYRVWILPGDVDKEDLQAKYDQYVNY